eukprot:scpid59502/ scgid12292/ 
MLTAPVFSPIKKRPRTLVKSQSSPTGFGPKETKSPERSPLEQSSNWSSRQIKRSSSSNNFGSLSEDDDQQLGLVTPVGTALGLDWKSDLDQWMVKPEGSNPPPELGHGGMPHKERKQAIDKALDWLRDEMQRMREEDDQLRQDFTNLYSEVHMMKMETLKAQTMLRYRSGTSLSSLSEMGSDDSDAESLFDFPDGSMVGNVSAQSLMGRQQHRKSATLTPPSLRKQLLTPGVSTIRRKSASSREAVFDDSPMQSTPRKAAASTADTVNGSSSVAGQQTRPKLQRRKLNLDSNAGPSHLSKTVVQQAKATTGEEQIITETSNKDTGSVRQEAAVEHKQVKNDTKQLTNIPIVNTAQKVAERKESATQPILASFETPAQPPVPSTPPRSRKESSTSRHDSITLIAKNSPHIARRVRSPRKSPNEAGHQTNRGIPPPSLIPSVGVTANVTTNSSRVPAPGAGNSVFHSTPQQHSHTLTHTATDACTGSQAEPNGYVSPPNISQSSLVSGKAAGPPPATQAMHSEASHFTLMQHDQQRQVQAAAACLTAGSGGTLPRVRRSHRRTSSSSDVLHFVQDPPPQITLTPERSAVGDVGTGMAHTTGTAHITGVAHTTGAAHQAVLHSRSMSDSLMMNVEHQSHSMPSIRDAQEEDPFYTPLRSSTNFNKYDDEANDQITSPPSLALTHTQQQQKQSVIVRSSSGRHGTDRGQPLHKRPTSTPAPFFQPQGHQFHHGLESINMPSPVLEDSSQFYHSHRMQQQHSPMLASHSAVQRNQHVRHHSADYTGLMSPPGVQPLDLSPLVARTAAGNSNVSMRKASVDSLLAAPLRQTSAPVSAQQQVGYAGMTPSNAASHLARKHSLSLPPSPGPVAESVSAPNSPKVSRSQSDVQRRNLAKTVALRCAQAAAAAPASPSPSRSQTMFSFSSPEVEQHGHTSSSITSTSNNASGGAGAGAFA